MQKILLIYQMASILNKAIPLYRTHLQNTIYKICDKFELSFKPTKKTFTKCFDCDITVFTIDKECVINVFRCCLHFLSI